MEQSYGAGLSDDAVGARSTRSIRPHKEILLLEGGGIGGGREGEGVDDGA